MAKGKEEKKQVENALYKRYRALHAYKNKGKKRGFLCIRIKEKASIIQIYYLELKSSKPVLGIGRKASTAFRDKV